MTTAQVAPSRRSLREPVICPTDEEAVMPRKPEEQRKVNKRSTEYILKSGLAGGLAGSVVCRPSQRCQTATNNNRPKP
jgi:solute carrier family 25 protein 16